ncbi:MAG: hypothetical protein AAB766_02385 [Patescibacteria group bacterium]
MINWQNVNWKKIIIIIGFIAVTILLGYLLYYMFFKPIITPTIEKPTTAEINQLPVGKQGEQPGKVTPGEPGAVKPEPTVSVTKIPAPAGKKVDQIAQGGVTAVNTFGTEISRDLTLDASGDKSIVYNPGTGKFYSFDADGGKQLLSDKVYKDVKNISWSPQKEKAVLEFPDGTNVLYNFNEDKQITLPKDWADFSFNGAGNQIAFKDMNAKTEFRFLSIANADGSGQKYLEPLGNQANNFKIDWSPNGQMVAQYKTGKDANTSKLFFLGQNNENFKAITVNGYGLETQWAPSGKKLIYSAHNANTEFKPELYVVEANGENIGQNNNSLKLNTWADKCTFASDTVMYCAVPKELPYGANLTPAIADAIPDYIYKVDLENGVKSFIAEPEIAYTIDQLQVSADEGTLFFTDKTTQALHSIKLK